MLFQLNTFCFKFEIRKLNKIKVSNQIYKENYVWTFFNCLSLQFLLLMKLVHFFSNSISFIADFKSVWVSWYFDRFKIGRNAKLYKMIMNVEDIFD